MLQQYFIVTNYNLVLLIIFIVAEKDCFVLANFRNWQTTFKKLSWTSHPSAAERNPTRNHNEKDSFMNQLVMTGLPLDARRKDQWSFFSENNCELLG